MLISFLVCEDCSFSTGDVRSLRRLSQLLSWPRRDLRGLLAGSARDWVAWTAVMARSCSCRASASGASSAPTAWCSTSSALSSSWCSSCSAARSCSSTKPARAIDATGLGYEAVCGSQPRRLDTSTKPVPSPCAASRPTAALTRPRAARRKQWKPRVAGRPGSSPRCSSRNESKARARPDPPCSRAAFALADYACTGHDGEVPRSTVEQRRDGRSPPLVPRESGGEPRVPRHRSFGRWSSVGWTG